MENWLPLFDDEVRDVGCFLRRDFVTGINGRFLITDVLSDSTGFPRRKEDPDVDGSGLLPRDL